MAAPRALQPDKRGLVQINRFKGLNLWDARAFVRDDELTQAENIIFGNQGELTNRDGFQPHGAGGGPSSGAPDTVVRGGILGHRFPVALTGAGVPELIFGHNDKLWTLETSAGVYNDQGADHALLPGVQYKDDFFTGDAHRWDGSARNNVAGMTAWTQGIGTMCLHDNRIFTASRLSSTGSRMYFSEAGDPASAWPGTNVIDVDPGDGVIVQLVSYKNALYIFKTTGIWAMYTGPDPTTWIIRRLTSDIQPLGHTVSKFQNLLFFVGLDGAFTFNGAQVQRISDPIQPLWTEIGIAQTRIETSAIWKDQFIFWILDGDGSYRIFVYNIKWQAWSEWVLYEGGKRLVSLHVVPTSQAGIARNLYVGFHDDATARLHIRRLSGTLTDNGQVFPLKVQTKFWDFGDPIHLKRLKWLETDIQTTETQFTHHGGTGDDFTFVDDGAEYKNFKFPGPGFVRDYSLEMLVPNVNEAPFKLNKLGLQLELRGRFAESIRE